MRQRFEDVGYAVNELPRDYGEDLLVRIFKRGVATPFAFLVQSKGTRRTTKPTTRDGVLGYTVPLTRAHLQLWKRIALPVIVTLWDAKADEVFWESVPTERYTWPREPATRVPTSLHIPVANKLDKRGINTVRVLVTRRHALLEQHRLCIDRLVQIIQDKTQIKEIEVDPEGLLVSYADPLLAGDWMFFFLGSTAKMFRLQMQLLGARDPSRLVQDAIAAYRANPQPMRERPARTDEEEIALLRKLIRRKVAT